MRVAFFTPFAMYAILFVCTDNMSRSPCAEGVLRQRLAVHGLAHQVIVASASTQDLNTDEHIDFHTQKHALRRGFDLTGYKAKLLHAPDFERFDLILAMDESNLLTLRLRCPSAHQAKLHLFTEFCSAPVAQDVPDLFYGKPDDFEHALDTIEDGCDGLIAWLQERIN